MIEATINLNAVDKRIALSRWPTVRAPIPHVPDDARAWTVRHRFEIATSARRRRTASNPLKAKSTVNMIEARSLTVNSWLEATAQGSTKATRRANLKAGSHPPYRLRWLSSCSIVPGMQPGVLVLIVLGIVAIPVAFVVVRRSRGR